MASPAPRPFTGGGVRRYRCCLSLDGSGHRFGVAVGFLSRLFIPRGVRRATHPARAVKRKVTPKSVKRARRSMHPVSNASYSFQRSLNTKKRRR